MKDELDNEIDVLESDLWFLNVGYFLKLFFLFISSIGSFISLFFEFQFSMLFVSFLSGFFFIGYFTEYKDENNKLKKLKELREKRKKTNQS